ncbi:MAG: methyltransferase family protein [Acidobacteriota bacterium]
MKQKMKKAGQAGRWGALLLMGLGACEVLIMISPFASFFYGGIHFEPFLGFLSHRWLTAWLDGFFLNHSAVTTSRILEGQRLVGRYLFSLGLWGFLISAVQVYSKKILRRGVATGLLYRVTRHPQYLSLGVAGLGLLTIWPRFLLLGLWVSMFFLYAGLARFEEGRMAARFGERYRTYAGGRVAFLPGNPAGRFFAWSFARLRPRPLGWLAAYAASLLAVFSLAGGLRVYTRGHTVISKRPEAGMMVVSAWPQPPEWVDRVMDTALEDQEVRRLLPEAGPAPLVATILPPRYVMKGMYYVMPPAGQAGPPPGIAATLKRLGRLALMFLLPVDGVTRPADFMGVDPDTAAGTVEVVFSRAEKPYTRTLGLDDALDPSVRLTPLVVADLLSTGDQVSGVRVPLPRNRWGARVVMPVF